jgi:hypothetical protein
VPGVSFVERDTGDTGDTADTRDTAEGTITISNDIELRFTNFQLPKSKIVNLKS